MIDDYRASSYQRYQGLKLFRRFDVLSYWYLSKAMDSHHVGRGRGGDSRGCIETYPGKNTLVIGIHSDVLFPIGQNKLL